MHLISIFPNLSGMLLYFPNSKDPKPVLKLAMGVLNLEFEVY